MDLIRRHLLGKYDYLYIMNITVGAIYEPDKGMNFYSACRALQAWLKENKKDNWLMEFNGHRIHVSVDSNLDDLSTIYDLKCKIARITAEHYD